MTTDVPKTLLEAVTFDGQGLVPVIAQEATTGTVRMFAWANREALERTLATKQAHFWSRSRGKLWRKGEESGHTLAVRQVRIDCDGDVVLYTVDPTGPSCHTGAASCFYRAHDDESGGLKADDGPPDPPAVIVARVAEVISKRRRDRPEKSYVVSLLDHGLGKINEKISEEAGELVEALPQGDAAHTAHEAAGVPVERVFDELGRRFGVSGIDEKASRKT